jgi:transposase
LRGFGGGGANRRRPTEWRIRKYVIQTEEPNLSAVDAVRLYKELSEVERAFVDLKDVLELRPIYHQIDSRVQAHIYVAALAFLLHRAIEKGCDQILMLY